MYKHLILFSQKFVEFIKYFMNLAIGEKKKRESGKFNTESMLNGISEITLYEEIFQINCKF